MASSLASTLLQPAAAATCFSSQQSRLLQSSNVCNSSLAMNMKKPKLSLRRMAVRASQKPSEEQAKVEAAAAAETKPAPPKAAKKPSFRDVMAFSGAAPETINGRLAMVGFLSALAVEAQRGEGLLAQIGESQGLQWFLLTSAVISAASLVPMLKGVSRESLSGSIMSVQAETWNGRAAMLGLVALAVTEFITQAPLV